MTSHWLSWITFTPLIGAVAVLAAPRRAAATIRGLALAATLVPLALATWIFCAGFRAGTAEFQLVERADWLLAIHAEYHVGVDGLSLALVWLTTLLTVLAAAASSALERAGKAYYALLLLLEVGILGVLVSLDFFLFFVFWSALLLPAFFLIGGWGGPRSAAAATKLMLSAIAGGALLLVAIIALRLDGGTFSIPTLIELARQGKLGGDHLPAGGALLGVPFAVWCFWCMFAAFALRMPLVPLHTWLADVLAEAPAPVAMLLGGVALELGAFGLLRACFPLVPEAFRQFSFALGVLGAIGCVHGALAAWREPDLRRRIACLAIGQMGLVLLGMAASTEWSTGGATLQLFGFGASTAALLLLAGWLADRAPRGELESLGGLRRAAPRAFLLASIAVLASIGLPGFASFVPQLLALVGTFEAPDPRFRVLAIVAGCGIVAGAASLVWALQRLAFGTPSRVPEPFADAGGPSAWSVASLTALSVALGLFPAVLIGPARASVVQLVLLLRGGP